MQYLVIMGILIAVAVILILIIITALVKNRQDDGEDYEDDDEEDYNDGYDDEAEEAPRRMHESYHEQGEPEHEEGPLIVGQGRGRREGVQAEEGPNRPGENRPSGKKLWKLSLENLTTWQKYTFVFYENLGIGRGRSVPQFEKFMSIGDDPRVSKLHCALIQKEDRLYLKDMGSRNGTYLNGKRVTQPVLLQRDDVIGMGETEIEIQSMMREK